MPLSVSDYNWGYFFRTQLFQVALFLEKQLYVVFAGFGIVTIDGKTLSDGGSWVKFGEILQAIAQARAFVSGKGYEDLERQVMFLQEGEHHLWIGAPPYGTADEDGLIL